MDCLAASVGLKRVVDLTILVSHRFSTVRSADVIVVVGNGKLSEIGDHAALVALGGTYAELYELQARGYRA